MFLSYLSYFLHHKKVLLNRFFRNTVKLNAVNSRNPDALFLKMTVKTL